jgi:hypothetical protein
VLSLSHPFPPPPPLPFPSLQLGIEHMFIRPGKKPEKRLEYFNRDPSTVLLIDSNKHSEELNPANTVIVEAMEDFAARRAEAVAKGQAAPADTTSLCIRALIGRIRADMQAAGQVNVPRTLSKLKSDAADAGFGTDSQGIYQYLVSSAEREAEIERGRKESGLGGFMRRLATTSKVLRGKTTTSEAVMMRPFRDPAFDISEDSLLVEKWRDAAAKMFRGQPGL